METTNYQTPCGNICATAKDIVICRPVIERLKVKESANDEALLVAIVENSDDAIIGKTLDGHIISWNPGAEKIYGYSSAEIIGRSIDDLIPQDMPNEMPKILDRIKQGQKIEHYETKRVRKNGQQIYVSITVSPVKDSSGKIVGASAIARDISERKHAENKLRELSARIAASNAELKQFAQIVAHDLQEPLLTITGFLQLLKRHYENKLDKKGMGFIDTTINSAERIAIHAVSQMRHESERN